MSIRYIEKITNFFTKYVSTDSGETLKYRQCLASLHGVVLHLPEMTDAILAAIKDIDLSKYKDSMSPLIKRDAEELLKIIGE